MERESRRLDDPEREAERPPAPAPAPPDDRLAWASAVGNQAVQRLARDAAPPEEQEQEPEAIEESEPETAAVDQLPEDELPE